MICFGWLVGWLVVGLFKAEVSPFSRVECLTMDRETGVQSQVESYQRLKKWYLIPLCLTLSIIRYVSRVKWSNPRKGVAPPLHLGVVAIEKGALGSPSTTVANF